jgi:4-hydroxy-tetrahydrodipicolinate reductase
VDKITVLVSGACGRMGAEVVRTVLADPALQLVAAVDPRGHGQDAGEAAGVPAAGVPIRVSLAAALSDFRPQVAIDFTEPGAAASNALGFIRAGIRPVIGTTGIPAEGIESIRKAVEAEGTAALVAPNFAIGAVLLIKFAAEAVRYLPHCEIIEMHHDNKKDAPSGTALYTALRVSESRGETPAARVEEEILVEGARGANSGGIPIHSVRVPGFIASQEIIFGGPFQTLTIRHDTTDRKSFMPGVVLAVKRIVALQGFFLGLESVLD